MFDLVLVGSSKMWDVCLIFRDIDCSKLFDTNFIWMLLLCWTIHFFIIVMIWRNYFPLFSMFSCRVMCKCDFCGTEKQALSEWERHTGSKFRNWKTSIQVKGSMISLEQWVRIWLHYLISVHTIPHLFALKLHYLYILLL